MRSTENIEKIVKNLDLGIDTDPQTDQAVLKELLEAQQKTKKTRMASAVPNIGRTIMKSPITKLAAAAVIIAVTLGLLEFVGDDSTSGVAWADVAAKVEACRRVVYREKGSCTKYKYPKGPGHSIIYMTPTHYRSDGYNGEGEHWISMYDDRERGKRVVLLHKQKGYVLEDMNLTEEGDQRHADFMNPKKWIGKFLACKYDTLERKNINGVLCEGIKTTDLALAEPEPDFRIDRFVARIWVNVETGYPILLESEFTGQYSGNMVIDQFQWDIELDPSIFEPNIPPDYEEM